MKLKLLSSGIASLCFFNSVTASSPCPLPPSICSCDVTGSSLSSNDAEFKSYDYVWNSFISYNPGKDCDSSQIGCGTEQLQNDISDNMVEAIDIITAFNESIYQICPPDDSFPCPPGDLNAIISNLTIACGLFNLTISNYTFFLNDTYELDCQYVPTYCDCSLLKFLVDEILGKYQNDYLPQWTPFIQTVDPSPEDCQIRASMLRDYVGQIYCLASTLTRSFQFCPERCEPCADDVFIEYVSNNMDTAFELIGYVGESLTGYCQSGSPIDCDMAATAVANLTRAEYLFNITIANYTQYLNDTYEPYECSFPENVCSCDEIASILDVTTNEIDLYKISWTDFINENGRIYPCYDLAYQLRAMTSTLSCEMSRLRFLIEACQNVANCPCSGSQLSEAVTQTMEDAISLIQAVIASNPVPCKNRTSFCGDTDFDLIRSNLQEASALFAQTYANFSTVTGGSQQAITCPPARPECSCRLINRLLATVNVSYYEEFLPVWTNYTTSPATDCQATAIYLQDLVAQYYCITEDLYRDYGLCKSLCNRDWCAYYNCSTRPCPPEPRCSPLAAIQDLSRYMDRVLWRTVRPVMQ